MIRWDAQGAVVAVGPTPSCWLGWSPHHTTLIPPSLRSEEKAKRDRLLAGEIVAPYPSVRLDSEERPVDVMVALSLWLSPDDDTVLGVQEVVRARPAPPTVPPSRELDEAVTQRVRALRAAPSDHAFIVDAGSGRLTFVESEIADRLGVPGGELVGESFARLFTPECSVDAIAVVEATLARRRLQNVTLRLRDGAMVTLAMRAEGEGEDATIRGWLRDVGETAQRLQVLDPLMEALPCGAVLTSGDGEVLGMNAIARSILIRGDVPRSLDELLPGVSEIGAGQTVEVKLPHDSVTLHVSRAHFELSSGVRNLYTLVDVSALVDAERALFESSEQFRVALETGDLGTWTYDPEARRVSWRPPPSWPRGMVPREDDLLERLEKEERLALLASLDEGLREQVTVEREVQLSRDMEMRWVALRGGCAEGRTALGGVLSDVTARKEQEHQRLQSQKLEALGSLASGVAHDFNNLLFAISGNAALARDDVAPGSGLSELMGEIEQAADRASELVRRILAFSRPKDEELQATALAPLLMEVVKLTRPTVPKLIELDLRIGSDVAPVDAYPGQLHQVLVNLITNAAHAIGERSGRIRIGLSDARRGSVPASVESKAARFVRLTVEDDGCGMPRSVLDKVFDPYFTTKKPGEGTGLGLAVVAGIVETHGGVLDVHSEEGVGTFFEIILPAVLTPTTGRTESTRDVPKGAGQHVLFVDDEVAIATVVERVLERLGYRVRAFTDPREALLAFEHAPEAFDVLITDIDMPRMSGLTLVARVRGVRPDLPVVIATGHLPDEEGFLRGLPRLQIVEKANMRAQLGAALERTFGGDGAR